MIYNEDGAWGFATWRLAELREPFLAMCEVSVAVDEDVRGREQSTGDEATLRTELRHGRSGGTEPKGVNPQCPLLEVPEELHEQRCHTCRHQWTHRHTAQEHDPENRPQKQPKDDARINLHHLQAFAVQVSGQGPP